MIDELGLTAADIGLLGTAFSLTYAFFQLPGGWLTDRLGVKPVYVIALGFWSLATSVMAFGHHLWHFMIARVLLGIFEAPVTHLGEDRLRMVPAEGTWSGSRSLRLGKQMGPGSGTTDSHVPHPRVRVACHVRHPRCARHHRGDRLLGLLSIPGTRSEGLGG